MPVTVFATQASGPNDGPDYLRAMEHINALGLDQRDPVDLVARAVVRTCRTDQSARSFGWTLGRNLGWMYAHQIEPIAATRDDILFWWNALVGYAPNTRNCRLVNLRAFYRELGRRGLIAADPTAGLKCDPATVLTDTPALTLAQTELLIATVDEDRSDARRALKAYRDGAILALGLRLCLREHEIALLRGSSIAASSGKCTISFLGKGRKGVTLEYPDDVATKVNEFREAFEAATGTKVGLSDPLILGVSAHDLRVARIRRRGEPLRQLGRPTIYQSVSDRLAQIGLGDIPRMGPHALRATGATLAYEAGASLIECQRLLRHASIETTRQFYIKRIDEKGGDAMAKMPFRVSPRSKDEVA